MGGETERGRERGPSTAPPSTQREREREREGQREARQRRHTRDAQEKEAKSIGERSVCRCEVAVLQGPRGVFHFQPDKLDAIDRLDCAPPRNGYGMLCMYVCTKYLCIQC